MNPILIFLILISGILLWLFLAGLFRVIGVIANRFINNVKNAIYDNAEEDKENHINE